MPSSHFPPTMDADEWREKCKEKSDKAKLKGRPGKCVSLMCGGIRSAPSAAWSVTCSPLARTLVSQVWASAQFQWELSWAMTLRVHFPASQVCACCTAGRMATLSD